MISLLFSVEWQVVESACHLFFCVKRNVARPLGRDFFKQEELNTKFIHVAT
jgi:hypothetical protein